MGNVSRAADNLCVTQPTVSRQLKELEEELGEKLFERTNYAIRLTPAGELLRERAEDILSMADRTVQDFKSLHCLRGIAEREFSFEVHRDSPGRLSED